MAMPEITPSPAITKLGSIAVIFVIAVLAIWAANNWGWLGKRVAPKTAPAA